MAIKGKHKTPNITWEDILNVTDRGYDVFRADIGVIKPTVPFPHPLRTDRRASGGLVFRNGVWMLKDLGGTIDTVTALQYTMKKYNLDGREALDKMAADFGLIQLEGKKFTPIEKTWTAPKIRETPIHIAFDSKPFQPEHHAFWNNTDVTESHCNKYNTWAVRSLAIDRKRFYIKPKEVVFAYVFNNRFKIYFPEREKEKRFKNNVEGSHLWNSHNIAEDWTQIRIQKSMKDLLVSTVLDPQCVATQNESSLSLMEHNYDFLERFSARKIMCYGSDFQGWHESYIMTYLTGWGYFNTPNEFLPDINDEYSFAKAFGIKELEKLYKLKGIIN